MSSNHRFWLFFWSKLSGSQSNISNLAFSVKIQAIFTEGLLQCTTTKTQLCLFASIYFLLQITPQVHFLMSLIILVSVRLWSFQSQDNVQLFWEGHKNVRNCPYGFEIYLVNVKTMRAFAQLFVAFSEKLNFTVFTPILSKPWKLCGVFFTEMVSLSSLL